MYQALVDFKYWTFIAQICNLLIQMLLFKKFLFKPVKAIIEKRREEVGTLYTEAEEANASAKHDKAEYSQKLLAANEEGDEILQQAQHQAQSMLKKADEDIAQEKVKAMNEIKNDISSMALDIAQKVVEKEIKPEDHKALIDEFIASVGDNA